MNTQVWVGTKKGAFALSTKDRVDWELQGPFLPQDEVHHIAQDPRDPARFYAAAGSAWFGPHLKASVDGGRTWELSEKGLTMEGIEGATLARIWHIAPGAEDEPGVVYLGADPGAFFRSDDWGANWRRCDGLTQHPTRAQWSPGGGGMMVHSIQPLGKGRVIAGVSAAGAFRSNDGGESWEPFNQGVLADFRLDKFPEVGQCVHKLKAHPTRRDDLYQQNHCGVYRAGYEDTAWTDISGGLPSRFGFCLAVPAAEERTLFTVPIFGAERRYVPDGRLRVARSRDGGDTWELLSEGLPQSDAYVLVLREAMSSDDSDPAGIYFGTSTGTVFYSRDAGDHWQVLAQYLPPVFSVSVAKN
jgi:photosystem II stability/assembly factor-like uncharacterized protein